MANPDRLTALDSTFLHLEDHSTAHMHVASVMVFEGKAPTHQELVEHILSRLHLVPRYRQRLAHVPLGQGRPVWADDPHFNPRYHIRHTALPKPADDAELKRLAGRFFSQRLDRSKPLWEIWLVQSMSGGRFAIVAKTHHALVDGISGVDITTVLFDTAREPVPTNPPSSWIAQPLPGPAKLLGEALVERSTVPNEMLRGAKALLRAPRRAALQVRDGLREHRLDHDRGHQIAGAPQPLQRGDRPTSTLRLPRRRPGWLQVGQGLPRWDPQRCRAGLGQPRAGALPAPSRPDTEGLVLKAMVPVSVRSKEQRGALGNQVAAMWAPLPVGVEKPADCLHQITTAMEDLKKSGQAVGAQVLTNLAGFAPPTILSQAARLQARQQFFNLVVTNVPGPQFPLYLLGRRLQVLYPVVPLAQKQALGIAVMSYDGHLGFGLLGDFDALPELDAIAGDLRWAIAQLYRAAGIAPVAKKRPRRISSASKPARNGATAASTGAKPKRRAGAT